MPHCRPRLQLPLLLVATLALGADAAPPRWPWLPAGRQAETLAERLPPPDGFRRLPQSADSFGAWLRGLPLAPRGSPVRLYTGALKARQDVHVAVVDVDVGRRDLQQCADAVLRLRAEYLLAQGRASDIHFGLTSGDVADFPRWARGERPRVLGGRKVVWARAAAPDASYRQLRAFLDFVFTYAGTLSLARELLPVAVEEVQPGDVFLQGGSPGHAVLVVDVAEHPHTGERRFLLAQSYMPAQDIHLLVGPTPASPWYATDFGAQLRTPEWTFRRTDLRRFR